MAIQQTDLEGNGEWGNLESWPLIPLHMLTLPDGKILSFGTNEDGMQGASFVYDVYDPKTDQHYTLPNTTPTDIFCSHMALDPATGNVLIFGGDARKSGPGGELDGVNTLLVFDPRTLELTTATETMEYARWYPSIVTLGNGEILALGGRNAAKDGSSVPEVWNPDTGFRSLPGAEITDMRGNGSLDNTWWYPHAWQRANGEVVVIEAYGNDIYIMNTEGSGSVSKVGQLPFSSHKMDPSIMYDVDRALMVDIDGGLWSVNLETLSFSKVAQMPDGRVAGNMNVLADGSVIITGGTDYDTDSSGQGSGNGDLANAQKTAIRFIPETGELRVLEGEDIARLYHSAAVQLEDGSILSAGGGAPGPLQNLNGQFFTPDIYFKPDGTLADRPEITEITKIIEAGNSFTIKVDDASSIAKVGAVKSGAVTHSTNSDGRYISLDFTVVNNTTIVVETPNSNVMIPGHWMVAVVDDQGVPSVMESIGVDVGADFFDGYGDLPVEPNPDREDYPDINGAFEVDATVRFDDLDGGVWQRVFDFGNGPATNNILLTQVRGSDTMRFEIWQGGRSYLIEAPNSIVEGETAVWSAAVSVTGFMTLSKNGAVVASGQGIVPADVDRINEFVGKSNWSADTPLIGEVSSLAFTGDVTFPNSDPNPNLSITAPADVTEGDAGQTGELHFTVSLDKVSDKDVVADVAISGGATGPEKIMIPAGSTSASLVLTFAGDSIDEADETISVTLSNLVNADAGTSLLVSAKILDDDEPSTDPSLTVADIVNEPQYLTGTGENDTFVIAGQSADYQVGPTEDEAGVVIWGPTGFDLLFGFDVIKFADKEVRADENGQFDIHGSTGDNGETVYNDTDGPQWLTGTTEKDVFVIDANTADYQAGPTEDGKGVVVWSGDTFDILYGFDVLRFNDKDVVADENGQFNINGEPGTVVATLYDNVAGPQWLLGNSDNDVFVVGDDKDGYTVEKTQDGQDIVVWKGDDFDILYDFETVRFNDEDVTLSDIA